MSFHEVSLPARLAFGSTGGLRFGFGGFHQGLS